MAKKNKKTKEDKLDDLFNLTLKSVKEKSGESMYLMDEMEARYGVKKYLSTGLPSWDIRLMHNKDRTEYGFPYGRISEIHGETSSGKTSKALDLIARNVKQGGFSYYLTSELDYDEEYLYHFVCEEHGIDYEVAKKRIGIRPIKSISDLHKVVDGILEPIRGLAEEIESNGKIPNEELPDILIVPDSIGAMLSGENRDRIEEDFDDGDRMGGQAAALHRFFKYFLFDIGRLGIAFIMVNHFRANLQGYTKRKPASDWALKYYCSLRCGLIARTDSKLGKEKVNKKESKVGFPVDIKIYKIRGEHVLTGKVTLDFYYNYGFDYVASLAETAEVTGIFNPIKRSYKVNIDEDNPLTKWFEPGEKQSKKNFRKMIADDVELAVTLEKEVLKIGPEKLPDLRGT